MRRFAEKASRQLAAQMASNRSRWRLRCVKRQRLARLYGLPASDMRSPEPLLALSVHEALTTGAAFERMFPADDRGPGAREIGVVSYLDRALAGTYSEHLSDYRN